MTRRTLAAAIAHHWRAVLSRAALPMLALAASYGVYQYALLYVPAWVAFVQAAAFELVYIGLAVAQGVDTRRARRISAGAVAASIIYNTLAGLFHRVPLDAFALPLAGELAFAALHGLPLAWVAYLVADLMLHDAAHHAEPERTEGAPAAQDARTDAPVSAWACVKCGEPVASAAHRSASGKWGCEACKRRAA